MRLAVKETETKNLLETLANKSPVGLYIVQDGRFCYTNPTFQSTTGYTEDELVGIDALDFVVPEDRERVRENAIKMLKGGLTLPYQFRVTHKDGSIKWVMESVVSVQYLRKRATLGDFIDITERKQAEERVQHLNLVLRAIRDINQLIARGTDRDGLLKGACDTFVKTRGYYSAWIALLDESGKLVTAAEAGLGKSFLQVMERLKRGELTHCGCKVLEKAGVLVVKNVSSECADCPVAKEDTGRGAMSVRLEYGGKVYGLMTVSIPPGRGAEKEEHDLLEEIAGDIAFALHSMEQEQERNQVEEALQAERNKLQSLVDAMEDTLTIQDPEYNIIYQNEQSRIASGGDHLGEKCYRVYEGRETVCDGCPVEEAFKDGKSHTADRMTTIGGKVTFWENTANPIRDAEGKIVSCLEITRDVTERKKQEQALADELTRRRILVDQSRDGIVILDQNGKVCEANQRFAEMLGYTAEEVRDLYVWDWEYLYPHERVLEMLRTVDEAGDYFETQHQRKDGSIYNVEISTNGAIFAGQKLIFCVCRDITERKQAEDKLQAEKNKLQSLIDAMADGLTIQDRDYNIIYQGRLQRSIVGDHLGEKCYRVYEGIEKICDGCPVEKAFKDGKSHTAVKRMVEPSGKISFWENTANPIRDASGEIVSCLEINRNVTERKKQEQALVDEATRRRILVDKSLDGIVVLDVDAKVVEANQRFADMLGYTLEEVYKLHTWDWDKNYSHEQILEMGRNVDEKGLHLETKHTRKDSSVIDVDISISGIMYGGQKLIFCIQRDVTERNRAEEALKNSEESYRELANSITEVFFAMDKHLRYTYWNKASEILMGIREEDAIGKSLLEIFPDTPGLRRAEKVYRDVLRTHQSQTFVNDFDIDGRHYIFEIGAYPSRGGISVFVRDITERKRAEEAIKHAAEEWRNTFDSITDAISIHDRDFRILRANKAFSDIFHKKPSQIIGRHCYDLHKGEKPISGCPHKQTLATKKPAAAEFYESHLGKYLHESTSPIFDEKGEVVGTVHITRDITEQKQQNERLMMADRLASIGELAAGTAHELNNPLTSVIGFSQLLMERDIPDDAREDIELIYNEAQRAANVTESLLTFGRKHAPVKQPNQINNIIEDVLKLRDYAHKSNSIEVERHLASDLPEILVDYFQMQQVFLNIIINAEYFMTEARKRGTLTITTKKQNNNVRISIADDGPGISRENLSWIFNPFFTTKEAGRGTGLGLSICHGIVSEHGGQIYARSQPGKGATIIVELPINNL